nr:hypothetical protein Z957_p0012 [Clostridium sp. K25]
MNQLNFVRFTNHGYFRVKAIVQYTLNFNTVTKNIVLGRMNSRKVDLPPGATNICLNILNISESDPVKSVIYHDCILGDRNICYETFNTEEDPRVLKTYC